MRRFFSLSTLSRSDVLLMFGAPALFAGAFVVGMLPAFWQRAPLCVVRTFLNMDCPGCGMTRALVFLVHGDWRASLSMHPAAVVIASILLFFLMRLVFATACRRSPQPISSLLRRTLLVGFLVALFVPWLAKCIVLLTLGHVAP